MTRERPGATIPLGRLGGIALRLDPLLLVVLGVVAILAQRRGDLATTMGLLGVALVSVAVHELAHAFWARRRGLSVSSIVLHVVPITWVEEGTPEDEWRIALAGPAANLGVGGLAAGAWLALGGAWPASLEDALRDPGAVVAGTNLLLGGLNLLPLLPADGGRAIRAWLEARGRARLARVLTRALGVTAALGLGVWGGTRLGGVEAAYAVGLGVLFLAAAFAPRPPPKVRTIGPGPIVRS